MKKLTIEEANQLMIAEIEKGWLPPKARDQSCYCHVNPPCSRCCLDGDYLDDFCEEFEIEIIENTNQNENSK